ncbi:MAG: hypothetical protein QM368_02670 [Bacillota bacterium]|nr:hypothetical protein [Bacillota bacterium]HHU30212.1 hypothetical protein [Bacillota bacterium]
MFLSMLDSTQQQIIDMFQQQMGGIDPATMAALQEIRESAERAPVVAINIILQKYAG